MEINNSAQMAVDTQETKLSHPPIDTSCDKDSFVVDIKLAKPSKHQHEIVLIESDKSGCKNGTGGDSEITGIIKVVGNCPDPEYGYRGPVDDLNCEEDSNFF